MHITSLMLSCFKSVSSYTYRSFIDPNRITLKCRPYLQEAATYHDFLSLRRHAGERVQLCFKYRHGLFHVQLAIHLFPRPFYCDYAYGWMGGWWWYWLAASSCSGVRNL